MTSDTILNSRTEYESHRHLMWYLYLIETSKHALYCGITTDVSRRFNEHQLGGSKCARSLRGKGPLVLRYSVALGDHSTALKVEYRVKSLTRIRKWQIITNNWTYEKLMRELDLAVTVPTIE